MKLFSERIRRLRLERKQSLSDVATGVGVGVQSIVAYEKGREPVYSTLVALSEHFGVSADYLLGISNFRNYEEFREVHSDVLEADPRVSAYVTGFSSVLLKHLNMIAEVQQPLVEHYFTSLMEICKYMAEILNNTEEPIWMRELVLRRGIQKTWDDYMIACYACLEESERWRGSKSEEPIAGASL